VEVLPGDVLVLGTDGLLENLFPIEIALIVAEAREDGCGPQVGFLVPLMYNIQYTVPLPLLHTVLCTFCLLWIKMYPKRLHCVSMEAGGWLRPRGEIPGACEACPAHRPLFAHACSLCTAWGGRAC